MLRIVLAGVLVQSRRARSIGNNTKGHFLLLKTFETKGDTGFRCSSGSHEQKVGTRSFSFSCQYFGVQVVLGGKHSHRAPASSSIPTVFREGIQGMVLDAPVPWGKHFGLGVSSWSLGDLLLVSSGSLRRRGHCEARGLGEKREGREQSLFALDSGA